MITLYTVHTLPVNAEVIGPTPMSMPVTPERAMTSALDLTTSMNPMTRERRETCETCEVDRVATLAVASDHVTRDDEATRTRATSMRSDSSAVRPDTSVAK
jgi:hypothetical protein